MLILAQQNRLRTHTFAFHSQSIVCDPECQNGGVCSQPNICDCSGTGYEGQLCEIGVFKFICLA